MQWYAITVGICLIRHLSNIHIEESSLLVLYGILGIFGQVIGLTLWVLDKFKSSNWTFMLLGTQ